MAEEHVSMCVCVGEDFQNLFFSQLLVFTLNFENAGSLAEKVNFNNSDADSGDWVKI